MTTIKNHLLNVKDGHISYYHLSKGRSPLVLFHGRLENGNCWSRVAQSLMGTFDMYMPDARGHGKTELRKKDYCLDVLVDDISQFFRAKKLKNAILIGHSMGAGAAALYAAHTSVTVKALILSDPPWLYKEDYQDGDSTLVNKMKKVIEVNREMSLESLTSYVHFINSHWHIEDCRLVAQAWKEVSTAVSFSYTAKVSFAQWEDKLQSLRIPLLLLTGNHRKGGILTPKSINQIKKLVPNCEHVHFSRAGHSIYRDCFDDFVSSLNSFLQKIQ